MILVALQLVTVISSVYTPLYVSGNLESSENERHFMCERRIEVDEHSRSDCSNMSSNHTSCDSLQDALLLVSGSLREECVEISIVPGRYHITKNLIVPISLLLRGIKDESDSILVHIETPSKIPSEFTYGLSFRNSEFVHISGVNFTGSDGVVGFDNVSSVELSNLSFR